jgi:hypothetical protein
MPQPAVPKNVLRFERLGYLTVVFGSLASMFANWPAITKFSQQYPVVYPAVIALAWALQLFWIWIIARKRQNWARWLSVATIVVSILIEVMVFRTKYQVNPMAVLVNGLIYLMWIVEFSFLFRADAKIWFSVRPGSVSPSA